MGYFSIVVPEITTNLVTNPSIEIDTTGYTAVGGSIARATTQQRRGVASLQITPTTGANDGVYYTITLAAATTYTFSVDVLGAGGVPYKVYVYDVAAGVVLGTPRTFVGTGAWQRVAVTVTTGSNTSHRLCVTKGDSTSTAAFYIDGAQCEAKAYATTYADGDRDGCTWSGTAHASPSIRSAQSRAGGRECDFSEFGADVLMSSGTGMAPVVNWNQSRAILPGAEYRGTKAAERTITLVLMLRGSSPENLHALRKALIDVIKPDLVEPDQPFLLRYTGSGTTLEIPLVYEGGLEQGDWQGFSETIALRCIAYDEPLWREDGERAITITTPQNLSVSYVAGRIDGLWSGMNGGVSGGSSPSVRAIAVGPDGTIYIGGRFTTPATCLVKWDGSTWEAVGGAVFGGAAPIVHALAFMPNGDLIVAGRFDNVNSIPNTAGIAKYSASGSWGALGTGSSSVYHVYALAVGLDGILYAGGDFANMGGVAAADYIAKWDGSAWSNVGTAPNDTVLALDVGLDGCIYAGGAFTQIGGSSINRIAKWNGSTWNALGGGATGGDVNAVAVGSDGTVYIGGAFSSVGGAMGTAYIAQWNGSVWSALGNGVSGGSVWSLNCTSDGLLYVAGGFTSAGGSGLSDRVAIWNGSAWSSLDIDLPGSAVVYAALVHNNNLYIGFDTAGTATVSGSGTVSVDNVGSASTYPIITIRRSGGTSATVQQIKNETTGKSIWMDYGLSDGETLTLDLRLGYRMIRSSFFGNVISCVWVPSQVASFMLMPGGNLLTCYVATEGTPTITCTVRWQLRHWSADAA